MANKKISDLVLISALTDAVMLPVDNGIQSYRATVAQMKAWVLAASNVVTATIADAAVTTIKLADLSVTNSKISDASITLNKLDSSVSSGFLPTGSVISYAGATAPTGYLLCDGSAISRTTYASLFSVLGVTHGTGNGTTTFNLPDYRGRFLRGVDGTAGRDADKASRTAMNTGGATGNAVGSVQGDAIRNITAWWRTGTRKMDAVGDNVGGAGATTAYGNNANSYTGGTNSREFQDITFNAANQVPTGSDNRPTNAYVNFIIKT